MHETQVEIEIHGCCSSSSKEMARVFVSSGPEGLGELGGEYVAVVRFREDEWVISSPGGVFPYFFTRRDGRIIHGKTVFEVMEKAGYRWSWNWAALGDLLAADYIMGGGTLHSRIQRVPPGCVLHLRSNGSEMHSYGTWRDSVSPGNSSPGVALEIFNEEVRRHAAGACALSLSGGLDSRAILSSLLRFGVRPLLYTMGDAASTDVKIAREISGLIGLDLEEISLVPDDYLAAGKRIVELTGGAKTARHWHTYIFAEKIRLPRDVPLFVGSNGGFARDTFLDYGMFMRFLNLPFRLLQSIFWKLKTRPPFSRREIMAGFTPELARELNPSNMKKRLRDIIADSPERLLDALQHQFYTLRLRNFIGYGLQMYSDHVAWCSPFLSKKWISEVWGLPHSWMLGSNWHRYCILSNYPKLMEIPETNYLKVPATRAPFFYRKPWPKRRLSRVPYVDYPRWFAESVIHEFLREETKNIGDLVDEKLGKALLEEHYRRRNRTQALSWMLCICFLKKVIAEKEG